jgi:hypothetical protein
MKMPEEHGIEERNNKWHLDKRVSVGHLIMTAAMVASAALWLLRLEGRVDLADNEIEHNAERIVELDTARTARDNEIIRRLERIQDTLAEHERSTLKHAKKLGE